MPRFTPWSCPKKIVPATWPMGIPDEKDFQKLLKHFCQRSCGLCGVEDAEEGVSEAVIEAEVEEVAEEIEEKEMEEQIEKEQAIEEEVEEEIEKEIMEEQEEELAQSGDDPADEESIASVDEEEGSEHDEREDDHSKGGEIKQTIVIIASNDEERSDASVDEEGGNDFVDSDSENGSVDISTDKPSKANKGLANTKQDNDDFGTFTLQRLQDSRKAAQKLVNTLEQYYNGKPQAMKMMLDAWLSPWNYKNPDNTARARVDKLVDSMARALVSENQEKFIIGTIGSSVAAGHDNCHYDSYESQLERTFGPVWEAAGMQLVCQNAGEGGGCGDDYRNQAYCIKQNLSPDVDIAHYTWTYFEEGDDVDKYAIRESLIRWTQMLPHQPPVHVLSVLYLPDTNGKKQEYELAAQYAKYGYNAFYMRSGYENGGYDYEAAKKNGIDHYAWGYVGDGYHNVTRYGKNEENSDRKESLGVVMRNWHPGPLAFEFVSDTFAYVYSKAMLVALDLIEERMTLVQDPREIWSASKRKILLKKSLPEPKFCDPAYCVVDEAPGCLNYEKPTYGFWGAKVEDADDSLNPHRGELQEWKVWHEDIDMWHMVGKQDTAIFQDRDDKEICRHLDQCGGISATSPDDGMVVFRLPKMEVGLVAICGCCGKDVGKDMFLENPFLEIKYNGAVLNRADWDIFPNAKCVRLLKKFPTEGTAAMTPTGHAYLSVKALDGLKGPVRISHVITL